MSKHCTYYGIKNIKKICRSMMAIIYVCFFCIGVGSMMMGVVDAQQQSRFDSVLERSTESIRQNIDAPTPGQGTQAVQDFVFSLMMDVAVPLIFVVSLVVIIIGFYKLMFGDSDDDIKKGVQYIIWAVVGIVVIMSARYLATTIFKDILGEGNMTTFSGIETSDMLYGQIVFPFLKMVMYLIVGGLFLILVGRVFSFILSPSEDIKKQSTTIIVRNIIAMVLILGAKQIVEVVYGKRQDVLQPADQSNLGNIGQGILGNDSIPILYQVINWVLGLVTFIILLIIILQTYQLLTNPDNPDQLSKIKKSLIYVFIGVFVIGAAYLITNVLIIK